MKDFFENMGFDPDLVGTECFEIAATYMMANREASMTHDIYPAIAAARGTNWKSVERSMRYALRRAEESPYFEDSWRKMGGWKEPTVGAVVRRAARAAHED